MRSQTSLVLAFLGLAAVRAAAQAAQLLPIERPDDELLILELRLGRYVLSEALVAYLAGDLLLLPLGEITAALGFAVEVDPGSGVAEGWFLAENRRFSLDLGRRRAVAEGRLQEVPEGLAELHATEIYVAAELFGRFFPIDLETDLRRSRIIVRSREKLPLEQRLERRRRNPGRRFAASSGRYPTEPLPHRLVDWPTVDHRLAVSWRESGEGGSRTTVRSGLLAAGDFLWASAELVLGMTSGEGSAGPPEGRLKMSRTDPQGRRITFGDLVTPRRPLVSDEGFARGVEVSTFPPGRPDEVDRTTLHGSTLPGWDVELYHNGELVDFQEVGEDGFYEFSAVPLYLGLNLLRLVFYGPQGQTREKVERFLVGEELVRSGESHYRAAAHQEGRSFLPFVTATTADSEDGTRIFLEYERGLRRGLTLATNLQSLPLEDQRHTYATMGLLGSRGGILAGLYLSADAAGGQAGRLTAEGDLPGVRFRFEQERYRGFLSERAGPRDPLLRRDLLAADSRWRMPWGRPLKLRFAAEGERRASGAGRSLLTARLAASWRRFAATHTLALEERRQAGIRSRTAGGGLIFSGRRDRTSWRGGLVYELEPRPELSAFTLTVNQRWSRDFSSRIHLSQSLCSEPAGVYSASLSRHFEHFALGGDARYDEQGGWRAGLALTWSLRRDPLSGRWRAGPRPLAAQGMVAARVFLDRDLDGRFGAGDEPLAGVELTAGGGGIPATTDASGIAVLTGLAPHRPVDVGLELGSLEDPYWMPLREGFALVPRPGRTAAVELPVVVSGEVDGTVYLRSGGVPAAVSRVELELLDPAGEVIRKTRSSFDGFYLFDRLPPGRYRLRVAPAQLARLGLVTPPGREVVIGEEGTVVSGIDFILERAPAAEPDTRKPSARHEGGMR